MKPLSYLVLFKNYFIIYHLVYPPWPKMAGDGVKKIPGPDKALHSEVRHAA